ncbi:MAG: DUF433 domain-containing protein [Pseudomonadota bacterium]|jgi:uncharacterized protein (DUF433 family)
MISELDLVPGYKWIVISDGYLGGAPSIYNKRISVDLILTFLAQGLTPSQISAEYLVPQDAVLEAIRFSQDEIAKRSKT